ncbi:unnamed protein product [Effrenium voratum]|nr:unnamed protein product [Effrenium voratum]
MDHKTLDQRWPRQVAPDLETEAARLLRWASEDAWGRRPGQPPEPEPDESYSAAVGSSYLGGADSDPWQRLLRGEGAFCEVPVALLERLRRQGEAQLAEIAELRGQLAQLPQVEEEIAAMEAELAELQSNCVVNANEIELRNLEAEALVGEAQRLEEEKQKRKERLEALTAQADEIEFWLDAAGHAPVGPEGRARVERFKAAAQAAAEAAERPVERRHSASAALYSVTQWKEFFQGEELADGEQQELETFFARIDPGRPLTGAEVTAAAGNPQIGLPRQLRGLLAKVASKHAAGAPSQAEAQVLQANAETQPSAEVQAQPSSAQTPSAVQTPGDTAKAPEVQPSPAQKPSAVQPPGDTTQAPEVQPSPASAPSAAHTAQAEVSPSAAQTPQTAAAASAEEDGNFTVGEWIDFFQEEGALDDKERRELEQKCKAIESPEKGRSMEDMRSALSGLGLSPRLEEKLLKILAAAEAAEDEETNFSKQEWMDFFQEDEDISAEELPVLDKLLDQMDTSGDGQISAEEITTALNDQSLKMPAAVRAKLVEFMQNVG